MFYSCTQMTTVGVKGLTYRYNDISLMGVLYATVLQLVLSKSTDDITPCLPCVHLGLSLCLYLCLWPTCVITSLE